MKQFKPILTVHARERMAERCSLRPESLEGMIRDGATLVIGMFAAAKYAQHLFYSPEDMDFYTAAIHISGKILTVMPESYLQQRITLTKAQKRSVRRKALTWEKKSCSKVPIAPLVKQTPRLAPPTVNSPAELLEWKVVASFSDNGTLQRKNLGRTLGEHGAPQSWVRPCAVHDWLKSRLAEAGIPIRSLHGLWIEKSKTCLDAFHLLEYLPMTVEEIAACA